MEDSRWLTEDESNITFDSEAGLAAASLYHRFATEAGMSSMSQNDARQAFPAGTLGLFFESSSLLKRFEEGAADNPNAVPGHAQVAAHAGPWYAYPGSEGVAVTDLIAAALVELTEGGEVETTITDLADSLRLQLGMN